MNQQVAKAIRKHLRQIEADARKREGVEEPKGPRSLRRRGTRAYYELEKRRPFRVQVTETKNEDGTDGEPKLEKVDIGAGQLVNAPSTTRGRYLVLKKSITRTIQRRTLERHLGGKKALKKHDDKLAAEKREDARRAKRLERRRKAAKIGWEAFKVREAKRREARAAAVA